MTQPDLIEELEKFKDDLKEYVDILKNLKDSLELLYQEIENEND